jgi:hypothetical protein
LDYEVPGEIPVLRQPSPMACWATVYTMLRSWRDQTSHPIETALGNLGQRWVNIFRADTGLAVADETDFYPAAGLVSKPLANPTLETWEQTLRQFGPLWVVSDVAPGPARAIHGRVIAGIHGDGAATGTNLTIIDPARGDKRPVKFSDFLREFEEGAARSGNHVQVIHWPKDARYSGGKSYRPSRAFESKPAPPKTPSAPPAPQPWSHYFHFRKGSTFEVDGPLSYNGTGAVLERTNDYLKFTMKMPAVSIFGNDIPAADMVIEATYKKEGKGNHVKVTLNGNVMEDADAEIISSGNRRTIKPKFSGFTGPLPEWVSVAPDGDDEIDLDMKIDGSEHDFDLNLKTGSSGLALGLAVSPWSRYFPFAGGTIFNVDGPLTYNGRGSVHERTDAVLKVELNMPEASVFGRHVPKLDLVMDATYSKEGPGNTVRFTVNGSAQTDTNATITTDEGASRRTIVPSIALPGGTKVNKISFAPGKRDMINLVLAIDGKEHDFDLEKIKGASIAQSRSRALTGKTPLKGGATSTPAAAQTEVSAFAARTAATRWKLSRAAVATRLKDLVANPNLVDQGSLNLCGPAAFFHLWFSRDPLAAVTYAASLFETGQGMIGSLKVKPDDDLVLQDYAVVARRMNPVTPPADWMCLSALRDSENAVLDFEGTPEEDAAGITTPGELADWMRATGVYKSVTDEGNWVFTKGVAHALALSPAPNRDILMLINANIISGAAAGRKKKMVDSFPNHFVKLLSPVTTTAAGKIAFDYWTWGNPPAHVEVDRAKFDDNYYGSITGDL